jgi:hypothetical protein
MTFCLFIYDLLNGTICISGCTASNDMVNSEQERIKSPTAASDNYGLCTLTKINFVVWE